MVSHNGSDYQGKKVRVGMSKSRKRKTVLGYKELAQENGFEWVGDSLPKNVLEKTKWKCKRRGHIWETRYAHIHEGRTCPYCNQGWRKTEEDYRTLASRHGIAWIGGVLPKDTHTETKWRMPDGRTFMAPYRNLANRVRKITAWATVVKGSEDEDGGIQDAG